MLKNYLNPENHNHTQGVSPGSSRRSYFYGDPHHQLHHQIPYDIGNKSGDEQSSGASSGTKRCSKNWIWCMHIIQKHSNKRPDFEILCLFIVGIAIVYLVAIGVVVAVLLLAPKYPSLYFHKDPSTIGQSQEKGSFVLVELDQGIPDPELSHVDYPYPFVQPHKDSQSRIAVDIL